MVQSLNNRPQALSTSVPPEIPTPLVYCTIAVSRWRWSNDDGARSAARFSQSCATASVLGATVVLLNVAASSVDLASVYCALAVKPLCSRRRSVSCSALRRDDPFDEVKMNPDRHSGHGLA